MGYDYVRLNSVKRCNANGSVNENGSYCLLDIMSSLFSSSAATWNVILHDVDDDTNSTISITGKLIADSVEPTVKNAIIELNSSNTFEISVTCTIGSMTYTSGIRYLPRVYSDSSDSNSTKKLVVDLKTRFSDDTNITYRKNLLNNSDFSNPINQRGAPRIVNIHSIFLLYTCVDIGSSPTTDTEWTRVWCTDSGADISITVTPPCQVHYRFEVEYLDSIKKTVNVADITDCSDTSVTQLKTHIFYGLSASNTDVDSGKITETYPPAFTSKLKYLVATIRTERSDGYHDITTVVCNSKSNVVSLSTANGPLDKFIDRWYIQPDVDDKKAGCMLGYLKLPANSVLDPNNYAFTKFDPNSNVTIEANSTDYKIYMTVYTRYSDGSMPYKTTPRYACSISGGYSVNMSVSSVYGVSTDEHIEPVAWSTEFPTLTEQNRYVWIKYTPTYTTHNDKYVTTSQSAPEIIVKCGSYYKYAIGTEYSDGYIGVINGSLVQIVENFQDKKQHTLFAENTNGSILCRQVGGNNGLEHPTLPEGTWKWAALYEGSIDPYLMPAYIPKGRVQELLDCQRYLRVYDYNKLVDVGNITGYMLAFVRNSGKNLMLMLSTETPMYKRPTVGIFSTDGLGVGISTSNEKVDEYVDDFRAVSQIDTLGRVIAIRLTKTDGSEWVSSDDCQLGVIYFTPGTLIELSAEP